MKRLWFAAAIFVIVSACCVFECIFSTSFSDGTVEKLDSIRSLAENKDFDTAEAQCNELITLWKSNQKIMNIFLFHDSAENIGQSMSIMKEFLKNRESGLFFAEIGKIKDQVKVMKGSESISLENIF